MGMLQNLYFIYPILYVIALNSYFGQNMHKNALFLLKNSKKNFLDLGVSPPNLLAFGGWGLRSKTSNPH